MLRNRVLVTRSLNTSFYQLIFWGGGRAAAQVYPTNSRRTDLLLLVGAIYYQMGNYEQCISFNDRCILLDPNLAESHANLANALQQTGKLDMAIVYYQVWLVPGFALQDGRYSALSAIQRGC